VDHDVSDLRVVRRDESVRGDPFLSLIDENFTTYRTPGQRSAVRSALIASAGSTLVVNLPTGGGKTLLAAEALVKSNRRTGLVLWMVPSKAIYDQTKSAFCDKQHPYRQTLERASGESVEVLEWRPKRRDYFQPGDIANKLCVLLISLQSATRSKDPDFLKINQAGGFSSFFPDDDDMQAVKTLLNSCPGLKTANGRVEKSLANVIKLCKPIIVLDEAHKAYGKKTSD